MSFTTATGHSKMVALEGLMSELGPRLGFDPRECRCEAVHGGSVNQAYKLVTRDRPLFVKVNLAERIDMFVAESEGLHALMDSQAIRVPAVVALGCVREAAFLALEWLDFGRWSSSTERRLGKELAAQHRTTSTRHGWSRDNTIGSTPQHNDACDSWSEFFAERRLGFQLELALQNALPSDAASALRRLLVAVPELLADHEPVPSLLHGDLWSGNRAALRDGTPVVFDPAVYFGDRETDLAMSRLFGGFGDEFYAAYEAEFPLAPGWRQRTELYNLYHVINHFNLFGAAYLDTLTSTAARLIGGLRRLRP